MLFGSGFEVTSLNWPESPGCLGFKGLGGQGLRGLGVEGGLGVWGCLGFRVLGFGFSIGF